MTKSAKLVLDQFDRAILALVKKNNQQTHAQIGEKVGLSPSAVRRRLAVMRAASVIEADVSITAMEASGLAFHVSITFREESTEAYAGFRDQILADPAVSQCYSVSGDVDFVLIVHACTPASYEAWGHRVLMANPAIGRYSSALVWSRTKFAFDSEPA
jgi:Lrp/AsnC family transcriptional regulator, leucine-responsive regulatory protein